ncbi:hypothetical protein M747DRAFT_12528 [Aspergillus niger ATCC 13496]|uniref:Uncharacterized protein n=1 Tax=Aspergillus niger ATCC 13496 TaxID=1353008 RepID=A0A370C2W1_ASPNG|nr:hypothetical protein M747DRAFT_12528 [Aspergillus niger ATCC 13496]
MLSASCERRRLRYSIFAFHLKRYLVFILRLGKPLLLFWFPTAAMPDLLLAVIPHLFGLVFCHILGGMDHFLMLFRDLERRKRHIRLH